MSFLKLSGPFEQGAEFPIAINTQEIAILLKPVPAQETNRPIVKVVMADGDDFTLFGTIEDVVPKIADFGVNLVKFTDDEGDDFYLNPAKIQAVYPMTNIPEGHPQEQIFIKSAGMTITVLGTLESVIYAD